jgi:hypothetical protein
MYAMCSSNVRSPHFCIVGARWKDANFGFQKSAPWMRHLQNRKMNRQEKARGSNRELEHFVFHNMWVSLWVCRLSFFFTGMNESVIAAQQEEKPNRLWTAPKKNYLKRTTIADWHSGYHSSLNDRQSKIAIECITSTRSSTFVRRIKNRIHEGWRQMRYQWKAYILRFPMIPHWHSGYHSSLNDRQSKIAIECLTSTRSSTFVRRIKNRIHEGWRQMRYQRKAYILRFPMILHWHSGYHSSLNDRQSKIAI